MGYDPIIEPGSPRTEVVKSNVDIGWLLCILSIRSTVNSE